MEPDLYLVMEKLLPNENVSPDMSSYQAMVDNWRGSVPPPTQKEVDDKWAEIEPKLVKDELADSLEAKVQAMWDKLAYAQDTKIDEIKDAEASKASP